MDASKNHCFFKEIVSYFVKIILQTVRPIFLYNKIKYLRIKVKKQSLSKIKFYLDTI